MVLVAVPRGPGQVIVGVALLIFSWAGSDHLSHDGPAQASESRPFVMYMER